jgi:hypothetical protein
VAEDVVAWQNMDCGMVLVVVSIPTKGTLVDVEPIESRCYLGNQTQLLLRGPQLWKEQVASKQSTWRGISL